MAFDVWIIYGIIISVYRMIINLIGLGWSCDFALPTHVR